MMKIKLAYGKTGLDINLPDTAGVNVIEPEFVPACADQKGAVTDSLRKPIGTPALAQMVKKTDTVAVVFSDITRPTPNHIIIPAILEELERAGIPKDRITLFNSTGTHRLNTDEEIAGMLGKDIVRDYRIIQNDARAEGMHVVAGTTKSGNVVKIQKDFFACSFKILTGFIEPHFFAGFSGGGKAVMPGMAHLDTVMRNHNAINIDDGRAVWGVLDGNPIRSEVNEAASMARPDFLINVTLNRDKAITASFAGDWTQAYLAGTAFVKKTTMVRTDRLYDLVITSNSGYPLDLNLYQAVKGMSAAAKVVKPGGAIIIAFEGWDGIPAHGSFGKILLDAKNFDDMLTRIRSEGFMMDDQWQAQILALIAKKADIYVYTTGLSEEQISGAHLKYCTSVDSAARDILAGAGKNAQVCVLPEGPQTIPYYEE
ncbi:MAG: nickel-dependent lactate racemase [Spirochaetales bacterium]|jgi:nickel-dependent lactate racemase|nr:nickel-dependent lactate racemase [Spirochaetales bacterium]